MSTTTERASMHGQVSAPADETCGVISGGQRRTAQLDKRGLCALVRSHPLGAFFTLAFAFSWTYWIPVALFAPHWSHFPGLMGPMLAAIATTAIGDGSAALRGLVARMVRWRVPARWYLAALVPAAAALLTLSAMAAAGYAWPSWSALREMAGLPLLGWFGVLALVVVINGYGEEVGWRGFVWSRLRESHSLGGAALILALPWALWHTPTFWLDTGMADLDLIVIPGWLTGLAAGSVVLGWLCERSGSSLFVVALFHAFLNMASATTATEGTSAAVVSTVVIFWAIALLRREQSQRAD